MGEAKPRAPRCSALGYAPPAFQALNSQAARTTTQRPPELREARRAKGGGGGEKSEVSQELAPPIAKQGARALQSEERLFLRR